MVLVQRVIKIVFVIQTNRSIAQIRNYLQNTLFPEWRFRLNSAFSGYVSGAPTVTSANDNDRVTPIAGFSNRYEVYPKFTLTLEVPEGTGVDARNRFHTFIEDVREWTRTEIASLGANTRVLSIHYHKADGTSGGDITF